MAARDKFRQIKFKNRAGVIYDHAWIELVEYEDNEYENEDYSEEYQ